MRTKIKENICQISGTETKPFRRYIGKINVNELIDVISKEKEISEKKGYSNLELSITEDTGIVDIYLYGDRDLTEEEVDLDERIAVIARMKDKTSKGMTRDDLLNQNKEDKINISRGELEGIIAEGMGYVWNLNQDEKGMDGYHKKEEKRIEIVNHYFNKMTTKRNKDE